MNIRTKASAAALALAVALPAFAGASTAFAQTTTTATSSKAAARQAAVAARQSAAIAKTIARADQEITRRITALNALSARIAQIKKVTDADKASIDSTVQTEISDLTALKTKIDADTDLATLRTDVKSIVDSYRIYALVIPQGHLLASVDSVNATADTLATLAGKIQMRLASSTAAGKDMTNETATLADMNAKISDARSQAAAAQAEFVGLKPDNGDKTLMASNTAALKDARSKIKAASDDLRAARKDAQTIVNELRGTNGKGMRYEGTSTPAGAPQGTNQ